MLNAGYPFRYLLRMIDRELSMVHSGEHLNVSVGVEGAQVPGLRFGHEGLSGSVPKMDISPLNGLQFVGINILVSVANRLPFAIRPHFSASEAPEHWSTMN